MAIWKQVKELTDTEKKMRNFLQIQYDIKHRNGNKDAALEYEGMVRLANHLVSPRRWTARASVVILVEEV